MYSIFYGSFSFSSIHAFNKHLPSHCHVPGPRLDVGVPTVNRVDGICFLLEFTF